MNVPRAHPWRETCLICEQRRTKFSIPLVGNFDLKYSIGIKEKNDYLLY